MPNGGSDCCGTCWFNTRNAGEAGYGHMHDDVADYCEIRGLTIKNAFYTYCANHPHHRPERDPIPIGPALVGDASGSRSIYAASPDSEQIRRHLLSLLAAIHEDAAEDYPAGPGLDATVVWQLAIFRDERAIEGLRRITGYDSNADEGSYAPLGRRMLIPLAKAALRRIISGEQMGPVAELLFGSGSEIE